MSVLDQVGPWCGLGLGVGLVLVAAHVRARRVTFVQRLAPYVPRPDTGSDLLRDHGALGGAFTDQLLGGPLRRLVAVVSRLFGDGDELARRLRRAGDHRSVEQLRAQQVLAACAGLAGGLAVGVVAGLAGALGPVPAAALALVCGAAAGVVPDVRLGSRTRRREQTILLELPTIAEILALAVAAGETPHAALARVARVADGELADELRRALADMHAGASLGTALEALAERTGLPAVGRFAEGIAVAVERGTPVAEVLRAQAQDVREDGRRRLMELGGRKEVAMLVPVVFLVLPVTILFAVYPMVVALGTGG